VKKALVLGMAVAVMMGAAACGSKEEKAADQPAAAAPSKEFKITASNWKFDQAEYKLKAGEPVNVVLENAQGIHGIEIKKAGVKLENKKLSQAWTPEKGTYEIICTIPCGSDHLKMKSVVVVE